MDVSASGATAARVLVAADWAVDPREVVAACRHRASAGGARFAVLVPAWLHGLGWAGDPTASLPRAQRQLEQLTRLIRHAGLQVDMARVGDPDPGSAIGDALREFAAEEILLCTRPHRVAHPLDLAHRVRRATGLVVREAA